MVNAFSLKGKVALITGATNGIGQGMAVGLAELEIDQIIFIHRGSTKPDSTIEMIKKLSAITQVDTIVSDLGELAVKDIEEVILIPLLRLSKSGQIDILINNAGYTLRHDFIGFPQDVFDKIIHINLNIPVRLTQLCGENMIKNGQKGKIIFTASLSSFQSGLSGVPYSISKGGLRSFIQAVSNEWSSKGINVNGITPGYILTNMTKDIEAESAENYKQITGRIPLNRWGTPDDFKGPVVFLSSDASNYVCGELISVDGGWLGR